MSKKLSIIRFKPKPEHYDQFLADVIETSQNGPILAYPTSSLRNSARRERHRH